MKIRLIGQRNSLGIGNHYAHFSNALRRLHDMGSRIEEIDFQNHTQLSQAAAESQPDDINISFMAMNIHEHFQGHNIQWIVFESTRIPEHIISVLHPSDQIWVPTTWGRKQLINNGLNENKVFVVPEGVDDAVYHPYARSHLNRPFRFLLVGKYEHRKSINETIEAFAQVFGNTPGVELFIKSDYFNNSEAKSQELLKKLDNLGLQNVVIYWGNMLQNQLAELYRDSDVFVFPSKGEGWGLPLIEAAAVGLPLITTVYSGQTEFLNEILNSVLPVDYVTIPVDCTEYQSYYPDSNNDWGTWARPDVYSIASQLKLAKTNFENLSVLAQQNSTIIRQKYSWANSATIALNTLSSAGWILPS